MRFWLQIVASCGLFFGASAIAADPAIPIEFNRDVRPILADHCFQCHGPDAAQRKADLRLDVELKTDREGGSVITAGQPEKSELWRRVTSTDPDEQMPPGGKGRRLSEGELATLRQWILSGGKFEKHWSLLPNRRPSPPQIPNSDFRLQNPIDSFVATKLVSSGLTSSPEADRSTILRRVTFTLTGLPPSIEEIETFLADDSPDAYEKAVDRLFASPRYGERMAVPWLDAARYADTSGYQSDGERYMWRWRDWVIESLNANTPFDQFTIEQLAGDLLPKPTLDQRIATGFNRNHRGNAEGGIIPEEYAVEYVADRVETTATVWLGLTLGCCRCHDHKYDPFTQRDFYSLFAFFNNISEKGRAIKIGNSPPYIQAPTLLQEDELRKLKERWFEAYHAIYPQVPHRANATADEDPIFEGWLHEEKGDHVGDWYPANGLIFHATFDEADQERPSEPLFTGKYESCTGQIGAAAAFDGKSLLAAEKVGEFGFFDKFTLSAWVKFETGGTIISRMVDEPEGEGYQLTIVDGKLQLNLSKRWLDDALRVETWKPLTAGDWHHVAATYDGSRTAEGVRLYVDGRRQDVTILLDELNQTFATNQPLRIGGGGGVQGRFHGQIDEVRVYKRALQPNEVAILATSDRIEKYISLPLREWTNGQRAKARQYFTWNVAPADYQERRRELQAASDALAEFEEQLPTVMVMEEMVHQRETHILLRGQYDKPGDRLQPNVPAELPRLPNDARRNRLGLARWLVDRQNPLTSRVIVNRAWQLHFGTGLVKTSEDFGRQGEWPSHPDLLDHLAAEFQADWDVKRLHRMIVTSAAYRQSSTHRSPHAPLEENVSRSETTTVVDPDNRLLSRGPRLRLSAEMVRDQALFASGQLIEQLGGPSVKPLQPAGLWSELTGGDDYKPGQGADLDRRSLYTFWKRTIPPPTLSTFDSPTREACTVRDSRTNTPLQALALLNEPTFVDASRELANRIIHEVTTPDERISRAMLHVLGRPPTPDELQILSAALVRHQQGHPDDEAAAYALICSTILNLDEAVMSQ